MSLRSKMFFSWKKNINIFLKKVCNLIKKIFHPNFCRPYSVPMSTNEFPRSNWSSLSIFLFLILLVPLLHRFESSFDAILSSSHRTVVLAVFFANFKILLLKPHPCWRAICQRDLPHGATLCL